MDDRLEALSNDRTHLLQLLVEKRANREAPIRGYLRGDQPGPVRLPSSGAQQRLWFIDQLEGGNAAYHISLGVRLLGVLQVRALQAALDALVARHEALRTIFVRVDGEPVQEILPPAAFALSVLDLEALGVLDAQAEVRRLAGAEMAAPFDLSAGPLLRGKLLRVSSNEHVLLITMHHIITDGWSTGVMLRELGTLYAAFCAQCPDPLPASQLQYGDYVLWQRSRIAGRQMQEHVAYWKDHLSGAPELLELPTDRPRPAAQSYRGATASVSLDGELTAQLRQLSRLHDVTLAMTLYAAWAALLFRLGNQNDIVIGMPVANRPRVEFESVIGLFINTLAVRVRLEDELCVSDLLHRVKEAMLAAYTHQEAPFERVVEALQPSRSLSYAPIFQVMFVLQNTPQAELQLPGLTLIEQEIPQQMAHFDLVLSLRESGDAISGTLNYATDLFDSASIERWVRCFTVMLRVMANQPQQKLARLPLMEEQERQWVLNLFNATQAAYPDEQPLQELFEAQVQRIPRSLAVVAGEHSLTYAALNDRANQLAAELRARGVGPDQLVGLSLDRTTDLVVGLLGILKAGAAYLPLDPDYPSDRLQQILRDASPKVLLTQASVVGKFAGMSTQIIALDRDWPGIAARDSANHPRNALGLRASHLAYVIYTSGSTGRPKGVMVEHRNVVSLWQGLEQLYCRVPRCARVAVNASFNFDASVKQIVQLLSGRTLVLVPNEVRLDAARLLDFMDEQRVDAIDCTPSQLKAWIAAGLLERAAHRPRLILVGGEAIDAGLWSQLAECSWIEFVNVYGPTESTVDTTAARVNGSRSSPHIGAPMENRRVYILDPHGEPVPIGISGEMHIAGAGVARGYLNQAELTAARFVENPWSNDSDGRMYKTGDLARWRVDGTIEYLGRNDQQVKIRGYRIELGEIEAHLVQHRQVSHAAVLAREDVPGDQRLVAYVVLREPIRGAAACDAEELRRYVQDILPAYMVPSAFVILESLPLTPSGKLNRRALRAPEYHCSGTREYEAPRGEVEEIVAGIWQTLLQVERVGRHDNFFELGGHSLLIMQMLERLRRSGLTTELRNVFASPTLADLASALRAGADRQHEVPPNLIPAGCEAITPAMLPLVELTAQQIDRIVRSVPGGAANIQDIYPLTPLQEGILFHHLLSEKETDTYVLCTVLSIASRERLDELVEALQKTIERHDVLRTAILWEQLPRPVQVVHRTAKLPVLEVSLDATRAAEEQIEVWARGAQRLDLRNAPLMRLQIAADPHSERWYVLLLRHHICSDHVTLEVLTEEVVAHLEHRVSLDSGAAPYRNHVANTLACAERDDSETYFRDRLGDVDEPTAPYGLSDVYGDGTQVLEAAEQLAPALAHRIRSQAHRACVSAATMFHAAWALVVACTSGRDDVVFGTVLLGRLQSSARIQRSLGLFINTLPLRLQLRGVTTKELLEQTQRSLVELLGHEQASLAVAQRCSGIAGGTPLFSALFNYRHSVSGIRTDWSNAAGIRALAGQERTNYPITFSVDDLGTTFGLKALTDYRIDPERLIDYLRTALESMVQALEQGSQQPAIDLTVLSQDERQRVIERFNATQADYPRDKTVHELFEAQVHRTPTSIAVVCGDESISYCDINRRANQLARYLLGKGIGPRQLVGICAQRSIDMIVGVLGTLKAGAAYVPLDPNYPAERLQHMLTDAAPRVVLSHQAALSSVPASSAELLELDGDVLRNQTGMEQNVAVAAIGSEAEDPVYVIYTSGSTGRPKGTAMPHRAMVNLLEWHRRSLPLSEGQRVLQFAALSFDVAFQEIFSTLCLGGTLVLLDEWVRRDARALMQELRQQAIERLFVPPLMLQSLAECFEAADEPGLRLRDIITAGEQLRISPEIVAFCKALGQCRLHNHYGPTETHVVTALTMTGHAAEWPTLPAIGRPISNTQIYVLNGRYSPVPIGVAAEIYIGGSGVAQGYLGQPELTAARFLRDPFSSDPQARMYKTGDLGRWGADGILQYLGRNDEQVKVRGYRIEPGEIEARLGQHPYVKEVAVVAREDTPGEKRLVAYFVPTEVDSSIAELRDYLNVALPRYMVPAAFVLLDALPLTPSGKLNRRALPAPEAGICASDRYEAPRGEVEETVAGIWKQLLRVERVGRRDNFFDLGGHSLLATRVMTHISQVLDIEVPLRTLFERPTVEGLSEYILREIAAEVSMEVS